MLADQHPQLSQVQSQAVIGNIGKEALQRTPLPMGNNLAELDKLSQFDNASVQISKQKIDAWLDKYEPSREVNQLKDQEDFVEPSQDIRQLKKQLERGEDK